MSREDLKQRGGGQFWFWFCVFTRFWKIIQDTLLLCFPLMWSVMMTLTMMVMMTVVSSELRKLVAAGLWQTGYHAEWLWCGQDGGGEAQRSSSRGLLLALGWLLAEGALEKLLTQRVQQLDRTLLTPTQVGSNTSAKFSVHMSEMPTCVCVWASLSLSQVCSLPPGDLQMDAASLRRLQWLIGCLRFQGRSLLSVQEERARQLHAVRKFSSSLGPQSVYLEISD